MWLGPGGQCAWTPAFDLQGSTEWLSGVMALLDSASQDRRESGCAGCRVMSAVCVVRGVAAYTSGGVGDLASDRWLSTARTIRVRCTTPSCGHVDSDKSCRGMGPCFNPGVHPFCSMAPGSGFEVRSYLRLTHDLGYPPADLFGRRTTEYDRVGKMVHFLVDSLRRRSNEVEGRVTRAAIQLFRDHATASARRPAVLGQPATPRRR